ncbi:PREDICTED: uncharacterized protein LOC108617975 [Drosophila arizonae]|uniref:Uncharacterized protein LOC108617975 n=2 Tax=Drosophila arizonae TaxID=7263 RepID=A0ABM1PQ87_DROAR|nr:PREDICTED: uncharacterized protein LOC108617975 [Drosophila arizonae]
MKIRIESEYFVGTFQSIFNWIDFQIATKRNNRPESRFFKYIANEKNLRCSLTPNTSYVKYIYSALHFYNIYHCYYNDVDRFRKESNGSIYRRIFSIIPKLTQLCFVLILLLPFCSSLIHEASGKDVKAIPTIASSPKKLWLSSTQWSKENNLCQKKWNFKLRLRNYTNNKYNYIDNDNQNNSHSHNPSHTIIKRTYRCNQSVNEHSLIILSQVGSKENKTQTILHDQKLSSGSKSKRTKRSQILHPRKKKSKHEVTGVDDTHNRIINKQKLTELVMNGLGLKKLPDMRKANISQLEYSSKYLQYLERVTKNQGIGDSKDGNVYSSGDPSSTLRILTIATNSFSDITYERFRRQRRAPRGMKRANLESRMESFSDKTNILLHFPLSINDADEYHYKKLDEANLRLMMLYNPALAAQSRHYRTRIEQEAKIKYNNSMNHKAKCNTDSTISANHQQNRSPKTRSYTLKLSVYQLLPMHKRKQLDSRKIEFENAMDVDETHSQWLEFDVTEAVRGWLNKSCENLGIEIQCDKCRRIGARILSDVYSPHNRDQNDGDDDDRYHLSPVLNIIGHIGRTHREKGIQSFNHNNYSDHRNSNKAKLWPNSCYKPHQRCCRHQLNVAFKDIKGFEFIIQPKVFDAGYCLGRCPPRHNPAHHHALLQSLIWQQDHTRVPRPCCAPSKLTELEILHVDENHSDKLKISTWSNMQVSECACS